MATAEDLMGVGTPPEVATRTGWRVAALTAAGTTQGGAPVVAAAGENVIVNLTTAGSQTACTLPTASATGDMIWINVLNTDDALVFPPSGQTISNDANSVTVALGAIFVKTGPLTWAVTGGAAA